jgi:hypothetical protein
MISHALHSADLYELYGYSHVKTFWNVNGQEFSLEGKQSKTLKTRWGTYKFYGTGEYKKID